MAKSTARVKVPKSVKKGDVFQVKTLVSHKMESGQRKNKKGKKIPRMIINKTHQFCEIVRTRPGRKVIQIERPHVARSIDQDPLAPRMGMNTFDRQLRNHA